MTRTEAGMDVVTHVNIFKTDPAKVDLLVRQTILLCAQRCSRAISLGGEYHVELSGCLTELGRLTEYARPLQASLNLEHNVARIGASVFVEI